MGALAGAASPARGASPAEGDWKGLQVVITGSGSALPDPERGNASQAVVVDGTILQIDCGRGVMDNLMRAGLNPAEVEALLFTHLHFDHIATYGYFVISSWIAGRQRPFSVYGPPGTRAMSQGAFQGMHRLDVQFVEQLVKAWPRELNGRPAPSLPVQVREVEKGLVLEGEAFRVTAAPTPHISLWNMKSLAYRVDTPYGSVVISGDTAPARSVVELARGADLLIHECVVPDFGMTREGKFSLRRGVQRLETETDRPATGHTSPSELGKLAQQAGVKKLVATHLPPYTSLPAAVQMSRLYYGPSPGPEIWSEWVAAIKRHYSGPFILAQDAMVLRVGPRGGGSQVREEGEKR